MIHKTHDGVKNTRTVAARLPLNKEGSPPSVRTIDRRELNNPSGENEPVAAADPAILAGFTN